MTLIKKTLLIAGISILAACTPRYESTAFPILPEELKDCKFFFITNGNGVNLNIVRCPNSNTVAVPTGKNPSTSIVIDGVTYDRRQNQ